MVSLGAEDIFILEWTVERVKSRLPRTKSSDLPGHMTSTISGRFNGGAKRGFSSVCLSGTLWIHTLNNVQNGEECTLRKFFFKKIFAQSGFTRYLSVKTTARKQLQPGQLIVSSTHRRTSVSSAPGAVLVLPSGT